MEAEQLRDAVWDRPIEKIPLRASIGAKAEIDEALQIRQPLRERSSKTVTREISEVPARVIVKMRKEKEQKNEQVRQRDEVGNLVRDGAAEHRARGNISTLRKTSNKRSIKRRTGLPTR